VPVIIDWESAGYINPTMELLDTALFWSGGHNGMPDEKAFSIFIHSYISNGGRIVGEVNEVFWERFKEKMNWLEFNFKRSLGINCANEEEKQEGSKRTVKAIVGHCYRNRF
jgi:thiamine kinase-like enzyme